MIKVEKAQELAEDAKAKKGDEEKAQKKKKKEANSKEEPGAEPCKKRKAGSPWKSPKQIQQGLKRAKSRAALKDPARRNLEKEFAAQESESEKKAKEEEEERDEEKGDTKSQRQKKYYKSRNDPEQKLKLEDIVETWAKQQLVISDRFYNISTNPII